MNPVEILGAELQFAFDSFKAIAIPLFISSKMRGWGPSWCKGLHCSAHHCGV